jgi:diguanylate cyclase (GGDEF)-like protein/PAS domain S-box-containing protein
VNVAAAADADARRHGIRSRRLASVGVVVVGMLIAGLLLSVLAEQIVTQDRVARQGLEDRTAARMRLTADFIDAYVDDLTDQIRAHAEASLAGPDPSTQDFVRTSDELRFEASVLLDDQGVALHVLPFNADVVGTRLTDRYDHLRTAIAGDPTISNIVPSAAEGRPIVAVAVPFDTPFGRRVLSGGVDIEATPLGALVRKSSLIPTQIVVLLDDNEQIVTGSTRGLSGPLAEMDAPLAAAIADDGSSSGVLRHDDGDWYFVGDDVGGAPWRIATTVTTDELYRPLGDRSAPWMLFAAFTAVFLLSLALVARVLGQRRGLDASVTQLGALTATLLESEEQLRRVLDTAGDAFVTIDEQGDVVEWNDQAAALFGWARAEAIGKPLVSLIVPEASRAAHLAGIEHFLATGDGPILDQQIELEAQRANGTLVPVELSVWAMATDHGWRFNALIRDVSDRLHQQRVMRDSEEELRLTQQNAATGMALIALDGYFLQANPALCAIVDRTADELAGLRVEEITHPDDVTLGHDALDQLLTGEVAAYDIEKRYLRSDGSTVWVEAHVSLLRDELDQPKRFIVQVLDIEERKRHQDELTREVAVRRQAEETVRRERDFSSVLLASMHEGYLFTKDGVIVDVNDQLCTLTGFGRADLVGRRRPWPFWPVADQESFAVTADAIRVAGGGDLEVQFCRKSGDSFPVALAVRPAESADAESRGFITIVSDLTEVRRREDALIAAAALDPLTGLANRRAIDEQLTNLRPADAVILLDLDFFKQVNDTHGHARGDEVLIALARCIRDTLRGKDWAGRLGGEEFVIVARDGEEAGAHAVVERLRRLWSSTDPVTTFSAGIAVHPFGATATQTLHRADEAMYLAKRNGRNRTEAADLPDPAAQRR